MSCQLAARVSRKWAECELSVETGKTQSRENAQKTRCVPTVTATSLTSKTVAARCVGRRFGNLGFIKVPSLYNETILKQHPRSSHRQDLLYRSMPLHHLHVVWLFHVLSVRLSVPN